VHYDSYASDEPDTGELAEGSLRLEFQDGTAVVVLRDRCLAVGTEIELKRGDNWYRAWIVEDEHVAWPCVRIIDPGWPGAPLTATIANLSLVPARSLHDTVDSLADDASTEE
jgi:hypothetical protein